MSTRMDGITQPSLFSGTLRLDIVVTEGDRYRVLSEKLPWLKLADVSNHYRSKVVDINDGRALNLRLHLGALISQGMNGWTDRQSEEMVKYHAGVRLLCGLEQSSETIDHTNIEGFRNQLGAEGVAELNSIVLRVALENKFTKVTICSSDTTCQEAPIAYPTEAGHLKRISEKLFKIGWFKAGYEVDTIGTFKAGTKDVRSNPSFHTWQNRQGYREEKTSHEAASFGCAQNVLCGRVRGIVPLTKKQTKIRRGSQALSPDVDADLAMDENGLSSQGKDPKPLEHRGTGHHTKQGRKIYGIWQALDYLTTSWGLYLGKALCCWSWGRYGHCAGSHLSLFNNFGRSSKDVCLRSRSRFQIQPRLTQRTGSEEKRDLSKREALAQRIIKTIDDYCPARAGPIRSHNCHHKKRSLRIQPAQGPVDARVHPQRPTRYFGSQSEPLGSEFRRANSMKNGKQPKLGIWISRRIGHDQADKPRKMLSGDPIRR